jgi:hypothetical protein
LPDRHIFRANADGGLVATGETAPAEPSRAIAPWREHVAHVAVEAPPPALTLPPEPVDRAVRVTKPTRRRTAAAATAEVRALPSADAQPAAKPRARRAPADAEAKPKRTRKTAAVAANGEIAPKRVRRVKTAETAGAEAPKKRAVRTRKKTEAES